MLDNYYDSYGYKAPEHFITTADIKKVKFAPANHIEQNLTEIASFFSESGQETGALSQSPLLLKPILARPHDYSRDYLTIEALEDGNIYFVFNDAVTNDLLRSISYSTNGGKTWVTEENPYSTQSSQESNGKGLKTELSGEGETKDFVKKEENGDGEDVVEFNDFSAQIVSLGDEEDYGISWSELYGKKSENGLVTIPVSSGDIILLKGDADTYAVMNSSNIPAYTHFGSDCKFNVYGNIMSLCYGDNFRGNNKMIHECQFAALFRDASGCHVVDASNLSLPATKLIESCYRTFFHSCSDLVSGPKLPATDLAPNSYKSFYYKCVNLKNVYDLPDFKTYYNSCQYMFFGCSSLTKAPKLPAKMIAEYCYQYMFENCTSLTVAPDLPATTISEYCYSGMFMDCKGLKTPPHLPAKTMTKLCYCAMFSGCTSLVEAPELPATTLANSCYEQMFRGCTSIIKAPDLPAKTLARSCYLQMFQQCSSLTIPPKIQAMNLDYASCAYMFYYCTSLVNAPELPAMTLAEWCYGHMFDNCTSLQNAPVLSATTLVSACYRTLFGGCSKLSYIKCLAEDLGQSESSNPLLSWVGNVSPTGTFVKKAGVEWPVNGWNGIPIGWTVEEV